MLQLKQKGSLRCSAIFFSMNLVISQAGFAARLFLTSIVCAAAASCAQLLQLLKLSKEKWEEARDHAMRAVIADNRVRAWFADRRQMNVGLLYPCRLGVVDLDRPLGKRGWWETGGRHYRVPAEHCLGTYFDSNDEIEVECRCV